jgi:peptidoglycan/LPS O-acetylase OafA/YrhL
VLVYHLWPSALPGGFVGVDVFFVISGFLITGHLLAKPPRLPSDLLRFWARRIRRLLPASLTVLAVTGVATRFLAPETAWADTARQIRSAALYVVNWRLAADAVDYSAAESGATAVQHFWSLSVEEQFYLGWPVVVGGLVLLVRLLRRSSDMLVHLGLVLVVVASLGYGIWLTGSDPARAYFVTPTRIWELGIGGVLATVVARRPRPRHAAPAPHPGRIALVWVGLVAIAVAGATYNSTTPFPGWYALVPVLGSVAFLAADDPRGAVAPGRLLAARPVQWLGDTSYSLYLWHWPLAVLLPHATRGTLGELEKPVILLGTLALAALTKRFVEDPFRSPPPGRPLYVPFLAAAMGMAVVVSLATLQILEVTSRERLEEERVEVVLQDRQHSCVGASALDQAARCSPTPAGSLVPAPAQAARDRYDLRHRFRTERDCWATRPSFKTNSCEFGDPTGDVEVALVGNSHAAQWLAALEEIGTRRGWRITTFIAQNCALAMTPQHFETTQQSTGCQNWVRRTTTRIADGSFDLVLVSNRISVAPEGETTLTSRPAFAVGYERVLRTWATSGETVVALSDTPFPGATVGSIPDCLAENEDPSRCAGERALWVPGDPVELAVKSVRDPGISSVDMNDHICGPARCDPAVGGVVVYSDHSHLTTTYVRTVTPYLEAALTGALRSAAAKGG